MNVIELTRDLVQIPSPSGEEKAIGEYLYNRLKINFNVTKQKVGNRFNIIATNGNPKIIFTSHMDTVPKQIEYNEDDKYIYARGACDAKGPVAAMIIAAENAVSKGYTNIGVIIDVSEEDDFSGIKELSKKYITNINKKYAPELVIVGEPTDFKIINGQKGLLTIQIETFGKSAHGSTPEKGICAISKCIEILEKLKQFNWPESDNLGRTTLNIGVITGGTSANTVSDYTQTIIELRTTISNTELLKQIKPLLRNGKIKLINNYEPKFSKVKIPLKTKDVIIASYFTEMFFWENSLVFGCGKPEYAHADNEKILKKDLIKAVKYYEQMI